MPAKQQSLEIVLANRLTDGVVIYLDPAGQWQEDLDRAAVAADPENRARLQTQADAGVAGQLIAGWEFTEVTLNGGTLEIVKNKQRIQSLGPTVRPDLGKQAQHAA